MEGTCPRMTPMTARTQTRRYLLPQAQVLVVLVAHPEQLPLQVAAHEHVHGALVLLAIVVLLPRPVDEDAVVLPIERTHAQVGVLGDACLGPEAHPPTRVVGLGAGTEAMEALCSKGLGGLTRTQLRCAKLKDAW